VEGKLKRKVAIGAAGVAVLAGAGGTYAATQKSGNDDRQAYLNDVAKRLNVSPKELSSAFRGAFYDRLDKAVADGRITRSEANEIKKRVRERGGVPFPGAEGPGVRHFGGPGFGLAGPGPGGPLMVGTDAAAKYLDLTDAQLRGKLESGKSLAQVARDRHKSVDGLKNALKDAARKQLDKAVDDKRITKSQEQRVLDRLDTHIDRIVDLSGPRKSLRFRGRPPGAGPLREEGPRGAGPPPPAF
jgi:AraC-like DNA-binding protein